MFIDLGRQFPQLRSTVLRIYSISSSNASRLGSFLRWQHGQRGRRRTRATTSFFRSVAIDVGLCRSGRTGAASGSLTSGNSKLRESRLASSSSWGEKAALGNQERIGRDAHRRVVMKASPLAPLVMSQADLLFEFLVVAFDPEPQFGEIDQFLERRLPKHRREPITSGFARAFGPFNQQPLFFARFGAFKIHMRASDARGGEA